MAKLIDFSSTILNEISSFGQFTFWEKKQHQKKSRSCIFHLNAKSSRHESAVMRRIVGSFIIIKTTTRISSSRGKNPENELYLRNVTNNRTPNPKS